MADEEFLGLAAFTLGVGTFFAIVFLGVPVALFVVMRWLCCWTRGEDRQGRAQVRVTREVAVQADRGMSKSEERFQQEYVQRATELRQGSQRALCRCSCISG